MVVDGLDVGGNHAEHVLLDTVELVETGPGTAETQAFKDTAHRRGVNGLRAIEDNTLNAHVSGKIFDRFGFACACGALGLSPAHVFEGVGQSEVANVGQWGHHQPHSAAF